MPGAELPSQGYYVLEFCITQFIETAEGHQILIDGGADTTILEKLNKEIPFWDRTLDLVILTHPDSDHLFGLLDVF